MNSTDLAGIPIEWQVRIGFALIALKYLAEGYSTIRAGGGLKRIIMAFWFGEQLPKVIADDYKKELSTPPFPTAVSGFFVSLFLTAIAGGAVALFGGCSSVHLPPGECAMWEHHGNYGPWQSVVIAHNVVKQADGTFRIADYSGKAGWLGLGPTDTIQGLVIGAPAPAAK